MSGLGTLVQNALNTALTQAGASVSATTVAGGSLSPNAAATTTAVNGAVVMNGQVIGALKQWRTEENYNLKPQTAIGAAIRIALIPGVFEGQATVERSLLFGQTLESAAGNILRPVVGQTLANNDFTECYFNSITLDNNGNPRNIFHDCMLATKSEVISIEQVVIVEDATLMFRWFE